MSGKVYKCMSFNFALLEVKAEYIINLCPQSHYVRASLLLKKFAIAFISNDEKLHS